MLRTLVVVVLTLILLAPLGVPATAQETQSDRIVVQGVLRVGEFFGPPNYGEEPRTDRIERSYYLQLPAPIATQQPQYTGSKELQETLSDSHFVQLVIMSEKVSAARLVGSRVQVSGSPFKAHTGHHRTPFLLQVHAIRGIKNWSW